jgi:hypothetical protein
MTRHLPSAASRPRTLRSPIVRLAAVLVAGGFLVAACGGAASLSGVGAPDENGAGVAPLPAATAGPADAGGKGTDESAARDAAIAGGPLIVRTGQLNLEVAVLDDALAEAEKAVTAVGGYVAASQRQGDDETASATVTFRIPVERWEATLAALRAVGTKVLAEQTSSEEVTSQVVDLGARLVNLRATEAALQAIMAKATKIPDILEVQAQLTSVRQEIEQLTAQKLSLEKQAALATLTVGLSLPPVVAVTQVQEGWDPASEVDRAAATLVGLAQGVASAAIWIVIVLLPLALLLGVAIGIAWLIGRRVRPQRTPPAPPAAVDAPAA